ncbi:hypothetical protein GCM10010182_07290 [Actinomadura cremea]|nr:hypothetical protein GCM10010182_07290 [Actinomadura cremea]
MAAGERQRDKRTGRAGGRLSWPTLVLVGGILLSLAANLAQAHPSVWGWITAGTLAGAFLVAVSMLVRRRASAGPADPSAAPADAASLDSSGVPSPVVASSPAASSSPWVVWDERPAPAAAVPSVADDVSLLDGQDGATPDEREDEWEETEDGEDAQTVIPVPVDEPAETSPAAPLVAFARRVATEHHDTHGRPITRDALRARLGVSNQLASHLLRQIRTESTPVA